MDNSTVTTIPKSSPHKRTTSAPQTLGPIQVQSLGRELISAVKCSRTFDQLLSNLPAVVVKNSACLGLWFTPLDPDCQLQQPIAMVDANEDVIGTLESQAIRQLTENAAKTGHLTFSESKVHAQVQFVASPITNEESTAGVLTGCFSTTQQAPLRHQWLMTILGQAITNWTKNHQLRETRFKVDSLNDAMNLVKNLDETQSIDAASRVVVNHLRRQFDSDQVAFVRCQGQKKSRLVALSDVEQVDETSPVCKNILAAFESTIKAGVPHVYPCGEEGDTSSSKMLEQYCRTSQFESCVCFPLTDNEDQSFGALLVAGTTERFSQSTFVDYVQLVGNLVAGHLSTVIRANESLLQRVKSKLRAKSKSISKKIAIAVALAFACLLVPVPYRVGCDCQLEPVVRRYVAAPYKGILEKTWVENGQIVEAEELLATMDGRSLRIELSGVIAEQTAAKKRHDAALATGDVAQSQIARSEMKRFQAEIDLLSRRLKNLEIRSPIAGMIVSDDLENAEGAPLETGQTLFEVGPLEKMTAEIHVPESEIRFVQPGMNVHLKLTAFPFETFRGTVKRIHTRSELINDSNVFVAEVIMDNEAGRLKPGMKGSAKIVSSTFPIGWNLFHRGWEKIRYWTFW